MATRQPTKICFQCKTEKEITSFYRAKINKDGRRGVCKACLRPGNAIREKAYATRKNARRRAQRQADPETARAADRARVRDKRKVNEYCAKWRNKDPEHANKLSRERKKRYRAVKGKATDKSWKAANPEKLASYDAKRRAIKFRASGEGWTAADVAAIKRLQRGLCAYCRVKLPKRFHRDHIVPLVSGGLHDRRNLQLLCEPCNLSKGRRDPIAHARTLGLLI